MNTRFNTTFWTTARGEIFTVKEMETDHLLNTLKMFMQKPTLVINMLIHDIETMAFDCCPPWVKDNRQNVKVQSIFNATSMTAEEACDYALNSCLGQAMQAELLSRGVNLGNYLAVLKSANAQ